MTRPSARPTFAARGLFAAALASMLTVAAVAREAETDPAKVVVTGRDDPELAPFDAMMRAFVARRRIPGAALAVARHGRLVYARGFGHADLDAGRPVRPGALFRIASVSKPITAATVLRLADRGEFSLDAPVLGLLGEGLSGGDGPPADPRWGAITVRQVLQHRGGWDRQGARDPMFRQLAIARQFGVDPPAGPDLIVRAMLRRKLDFDPGTRFAYSNFGYCLLGRLVEEVTGLPYEQAVRRELLAPLGLGPRSIRLGRTLPEGRAPGEVRYYDRAMLPAVVGQPQGRPMPAPYGAWAIETLDAHGGWIASAPVLVKFAAAFEAPEACRLLSPAMAAAMFARPPGVAGLRRDGTPKAVYYACGWSVRPVGAGGFNAFHAGSLPGTSALLVRRSDGLCWAVLFNTRDAPGEDDGGDGEEPAAAVDPLVHKAAAAVRRWPDHDLAAE